MERGQVQSLGRCQTHCPGEKNRESLEHSSLGSVAAYLITGIVCKFSIVVVIVIVVSVRVVSVRTNKQRSKHMEKQGFEGTYKRRGSQRGNDP